MSKELYCPICGNPASIQDKICSNCEYNLEEWMRLKGIVAVPEQKPTVIELIFEVVGSLRNPKPMTQPPSSTVFLNRSQKSTTGYLLSAVILLVVGFVLGYGGDWLTYIGFSLAGYAIPVILLIYIVRSDRYEREPIALVAYCFGWGAFSGIIASPLNALFINFLGPGVAGFIEEPLKIIGVYWIAKNTQLKNEFNNHLDGMIYGAAAGAGFAGLENFGYIIDMVLRGDYPPIFAILTRSLAGMMHIAWSSIAARSLGLAKVVKGSIDPSDLIPGTLISAIFHFLWNTAPTPFSLGLIFPFTLSSVRGLIRTALQDERNWGYEFYAPDEES